MYVVHLAFWENFYIFSKNLFLFKICVSEERVAILNEVEGWPVIC
jgi:hypothetical protein